MGNMRCRIQGCTGEITSKVINLHIGGGFSGIAHCCSECARAYWISGNPVFTKDGRAIFKDCAGDRPSESHLPILVVVTRLKRGKVTGFTLYSVNQQEGYLNSSSGKFDAKKKKDILFLPSVEALKEKVAHMLNDYKIEDYKL